MTKKPKFIALIPARKGSKGLINKNMRNLQKKPLVQHTIEAALGTSRMDEIWVSSNDGAILKLAESLKVHTVIRPEEYADDMSSAVEVVNHFLSTISSRENFEDDFIVYLQPTSPIRNSHHIEAAIEIMLKQNLNSLVSVCLLRKSPYKAFLIDQGGMLQALFDEELSNARRQDLQNIYIPNGAIYIFQIKEFLDRCGFPSNGSFPFIMSEDDSTDIDEEEDLLKAERIMRIKNA